MEAHEKRCWRNPNRTCELCNGTGFYEEDYGGGIIRTECYYCSKYRADFQGVV
jgi:hypothetical protein